jgi:hypothetical protein
MAIGRKTGGRQKGTPNKATSAASINAEIAASGELPLEYMLRVMRDETAESLRRDAMAKAAAPLPAPAALLDNAKASQCRRQSGRPNDHQPVRAATP